MGSKLAVNQFDYLLLFLIWIPIKYSLCQMSCGPRMSPRLLMEIPCDMSKTSFCTQPGSAYPWSSVRRYIYENQGFMRRMYGDQRQSQVLRDEFEEGREKYDSIHFYGRGRAQTAHVGFGARSATASDFTSTIPSPTTVSSHNSTQDLTPNKSIENNTTTHESEDKSSLDRQSVDVEEEETLEMESTRFDTNPPTTTSTDTNHEPNDIPNPEFYVNSVTPQTTTTTSETKEEQNESQPKKGVNACPIKEEVVAPYWANNTRGEILALLNVYPFEQYIHSELCVNSEENLCRTGCVCEQKYRLHRLLAFDPKNECRGIFADWFRFPGCCVCICYLDEKKGEDPMTGGRINRRKARL